MASPSPGLAYTRHGPQRDETRGLSSRGSSEQSYNDSEDSMADSSTAGITSGPSRDAYTKMDQIVHASET